MVIMLSGCETVLADEPVGVPIEGNFTSWKTWRFGMSYLPKQLLLLGALTTATQAQRVLDFKALDHLPHHNAAQLSSIHFDTMRHTALEAGRNALPHDPRGQLMLWKPFDPTTVALQILSAPVSLAVAVGVAAAAQDLGTGDVLGGTGQWGWTAWGGAMALVTTLVVPALTYEHFELDTEHSMIALGGSIVGMLLGYHLSATTVYASPVEQEMSTNKRNSPMNSLSGLHKTVPHQFLQVSVLSISF
jgi:hypothetical protein